MESSFHAILPNSLAPPEKHREGKLYKFESLLSLCSSASGSGLDMEDGNRGVLRSIVRALFVPLVTGHSSGLLGELSSILIHFDSLYFPFRVITTTPARQRSYNRTAPLTRYFPHPLHNAPRVRTMLPPK